MEKLIIFIKNLWTQTIAPTVDSLNRKNKENSDRIITAIYDKENNAIIDNPEDISSPIVEAQKETTQAIRDIPKVELPDIDLNPLEEKLEALRRAFESKEMSIKVGKTKVNVDTKSVVKAIERLQLTIPELKPQEQTDYTLMLDEMMKIMERPQDHTEIKKLQELVKRLGTSEDLFMISEWLRVIAEKPQPEFPKLNFDEDGRLKVRVDRVGGGGGGLTSLEAGYLKTISENSEGKATEAKQDDIISAINNVSGLQRSTDIDGGGKVSVGTTAVEATFTGATESIVITADKDNTGVLYIGKSNVTNLGANAMTFLESGDSITLSYDDATNGIYVVASVAGQYFWKGSLL